MFSYKAIINKIIGFCSPKYKIINTTDLKKKLTHIAIIMDGNGRWAQSMGKSRLYGYANAKNSIVHVLEEIVRLEIKFFTVFAFSSDNWMRPSYEVNEIFRIIYQVLFEYKSHIVSNNIKVKFIGRRDRITKECVDLMDQYEKISNSNTGLVFTIALDYSGKEDIINAAERLKVDFANSSTSEIKNSQLQIHTIEYYMQTNYLPDVDLLIRTGNEKRLSNFMLYKLAYTELVFFSIMWPDFSVRHLHLAIIDFMSRHRRFGNIK